MPNHGKKNQCQNSQHTSYVPNKIDYIIPSTKQILYHPNLLGILYKLATFQYFPIFLVAGPTISGCFNNLCHLGFPTPWRSNSLRRRHSKGHRTTKKRAPKSLFQEWYKPPESAPQGRVSWAVFLLVHFQREQERKTYRVWYMVCMYMCRYKNAKMWT